MILHPRLLALALALAPCALTGCAGRTVMVNGSQVPYDEAAAASFARARDAFAAGRWDEAAQKFAAFLNEFPDSELADEARFRRAQALERAGKLEEAQKALQDDLEKHPTSKFKSSEAVELGLVQGKLGKSPGAQGAVAPNLEQMSEEEKKKAAPSIAEALEQAGRRGESVRWAAKALEAAERGREKDERLADYTRVLEAAPAEDVAKLVAELDHASPAWAPAALKLARIQLHLGDRVHAQELAQQIVASGAQGPYAEGAQAVQVAVQGPGSVKPNLVGVVLPLTGDLKVFAEPILDAIALKIDLLGKGPVQLEVKDSKNDPAGAARAVEELARDGVIAILGPIGLAEGPAAAARAQQLGVPMISLSRAENLTQMGPYVFRNMLTNSAQARAVADYAQKKLNAKTFGLLQPDSPYGDDMVRYFWDALDQSHGQVTAFERYPRETTTFKPYVAKMVGRYNLSERKEFIEQQEKLLKDITDPYRRRKALAQLKSQTAPIVDFDALFIPDGARTVRLIAPAIAAEDVITSGCDARDLETIKKTKGKDELRTVQLLGTNLWDSPDLVDDRMGAARYVQCAIFADGFFVSSQRRATQKFVADYDAAYHRQPSFLEAHGHDAAGILRDLLERKRPQTREELRALLAQMDKPFEGASGTIRFGPDREAQKTLFWLWINRGSIQEFDPDGPPPVPPTAPPPAEAPAAPPAR
jgi:ABC-type branched-subunit amino acid transport system substrate-binding protein/predicted negative regulator of RcsB-dependent stress response